MPRVIIFQANGHSRSTIVCDAMLRGMRRQREDVELRASTQYSGRLQAEVAVFYGLSDGLRRIFADYRKSRKAIYIDLGYWGRRKKTRWDGYHKAVLNDRHPTAYFQNRRHPNDRFAKFGIPIQPWRDGGRHIIVAGMSAKAAATEGLAPEQWERQTVQQLRKFTDRPIIYRPKPNWLGARPIPGTRFERDVPLEQSLAGAHAVVTHHSNVGVDALLAGVPVFTVEGAARPLSTSCEFLHLIETPERPEGRERWAADLAYCQFSIEEMAEGLAWRTLRLEGLV